MSHTGVDFVEFENGPVRLTGRDGNIIAVSSLWLARGYLQEQVIPTPETEEILRQLDAATDPDEAHQALRSFCAWADAAGVRVT